MGRFYEADKSVKDLIEELIYDDERFPNLKAATIKVVMDSKSKIDKLTNTLTFASIKLANEVEKFLSKDGHNLEGVDYIMFINDVVWELANDTDKKRLVSHELRHTFIDDKGNFRIIRHDIEDFHIEIKFNSDDPMWKQALATIALVKIEQIKEESKANR